MAIGGNVIIPLLTAFNDDGVKKAMHGFDALASKIKDFGTTAVKAFGFYKLSSMTTNFIEQSITAARDYQQAMAGVNTVYGEYTSKVSEFIQASEKIGMSHAEAARNVTFLGSVFKKTGIPMDEVINKTETLVRLASDLASTYGHPVSEAMTGIAAMFRGEYDPIEKFGVAMKQNQVNALLAARGQQHLTGQMQIAAATLARYDLLLQNSTDAQGAFARQTSNLFEQQQILKAGWTDIQQVIGEKLIPVVTDFIARIQPLMRDIAPSLAALFTEIGTIITDYLLPALPDMMTQFAVLLESVKKFFTTFNSVLGVIGSSIATMLGPTMVFIGIFKTIYPLFTFTAKAVKAYTVAVKAAAVAEKELAVGEALVMALSGPAGIAAVAAALAVAGAATAVIFGSEIPDAFKKTETASPEMVAAIQPVVDKLREMGLAARFASDETDRWVARRFDRPVPIAKTVDPFNLLDLNKQLGLTKTKTKTFFDTLAEDMAKQAARAKLTGLGASAGLIEAIIGSTNWESTYKKVLSGGAKYVSQLQGQFNQTKTGLEELAKVQEDAAKAAQDYADAQQKVADAITAFTTSMADILVSVSPLPTVTKTLGQFEQAVVNTFTNIYDSLKNAVESKLLLQSSADDLSAYAKNTQATLQRIAAERDAIAQKIQDANSLIDSTKSAVLGFVNLNDLLQSTSQAVTEQTVSMIDGIRLTLTRTFDIQKVTGDLTQGFKDILDRTKKFAGQLKSLKAMGLTGGLFQQIVSAGLDAGSATASAILQGGQGTVDELNGLFNDLQSVGADVAETTAQVMYGAGIDVTNGLIAGLLSKSDQLAQAAQTLADAFTTSFNERMAGFMNSDAYLLGGLTPPNTSGVAESFTGGYGSIATGGGMGGAVRAASVGTNYTINVNSGIITDPSAVGQAVVNSIIRYERTNGAVWVRSA